MSRLTTSLSFETTFGTYTCTEQLGEGGAGRVFGGTDTENRPVAIKVLAPERANTEKRRRFKNEIAFLTKCTHRNLVAVLDHGVLIDKKGSQPFYVMPRYSGSLRDLIKQGIAKEAALSLFSQILDGIEAAHLKDAIHRDLKPENILYEKSTKTLAVADFGIARFTEDLVVTLVETRADGRMGNFQYAAPEQRTTGHDIQVAADIYALGLMLNEMFTGSVPHGTAYKQIADVAAEYAFLDQIVGTMLRQSPGDRPGSILEVKQFIRRYEAEAVSLQKLSKIDGAVVSSAEIDEPLALDPPKLIDFDWRDGQLTLILDRPVTQNWINALQNMSSFRSVLGKGPHRFSFNHDRASVSAGQHEVQLVIDHFKQWLPQASETLKGFVEHATRQREAQERERLRRERTAEEERLRVLRQVKI